jgi:hypothetical protein
MHPFICAMLCMLLHVMLCYQRKAAAKSDARITCGAASSDTHESIKALALLAHQVEVLFVMCTLLAGKRKVQVQDRLMELDIVPALLQMFDRLDWNRAPSTTPPMERCARERGHARESTRARELSGRTACCLDDWCLALLACTRDLPNAVS